MTRVIKVGGRTQSDPTLAPRLARWTNASPGATILVHGGGDEVTALQAALGIVSQFVDGRRVTTPADIDLVRMALSGSANKRLVAALQDQGVRAIGLSGEDGALIDATADFPEQLGLVGTPDSINTSLLELLIGAGYLPVISPVSRNARGTLGPTLNVNGDDAAAAIAVAVGADELLLVSDVVGVMRDHALLTSMLPEDARAMLDDSTACGGMRAKLQAALFALGGGVQRVRISDLAAIDEPDRGTLLVRTGEL